MFPESANDPSLIDWNPTASISALSKRAQLLAALRHYFTVHGAMEVETPLLSQCGTTDPAIESFTVQTKVKGQRYLQTSPEFAMKRLLAAGSGDIYQISKAFRAGEEGQHHNPEFTLLEWYRVGWDENQLAAEVVELVCMAANALGYNADFQVEYSSFAKVFEKALEIDPHRATVDELARVAKNAAINPTGNLSHDDWLDVLMGMIIAPSFPPDRLTILNHYPASQAALAKIYRGDPPVAARFEVFGGPIELANGFYELLDPVEQKQRFEADVQHRLTAGQADVFPDDRLIAALAAGMPDCAGVALGIDRLLLWLMHERRLSSVMSFDWERA